MPIFSQSGRLIVTGGRLFIGERSHCLSTFILWSGYWWRLVSILHWTIGTIHYWLAQWRAQFALDYSHFNISDSLGVKYAHLRRSSATFRLPAVSTTVRLSLLCAAKFDEITFLLLYCVGTGLLLSWPQTSEPAHFIQHARFINALHLHLWNQFE